MKWYAINEAELMSFHMAAVLCRGDNFLAQGVVDGIRAREISKPVESRKTSTNKRSTPVAKPTSVRA